MKTLPIFTLTPKMLREALWALTPQETIRLAKEIEPMLHEYLQSNIEKEDNAIRLRDFAASINSLKGKLYVKAKNYADKRIV